MLTDTSGLHHVTAIAGEPQPNVDFYAGALGLRLVTRTVNHEDQFAYHFYYGDRVGTPGTVLTFFAYPHEESGRIGKPQAEAVAFAVPESSIDDWLEYLRRDGSDVGDAPAVRELEGPIERFGERAIRFRDPDGTRLELVGSSDLEFDADERSPIDPWTGAVPERMAIRGLHGVTLLSANPYGTASVLETLGFDLEGQEGDRVRYRASGTRATVVDLLDRDVPYGREGAGTIHHVAVRVGSADELFEWHDLFRERGYDVSRVKDRYYYRALYVRGPGGILFELATDESGLRHDRETDAPGQRLELPPWLEEDRELIESQLPPLTVPSSNAS